MKKTLGNINQECNENYRTFGKTSSSYDAQAVYFGW